MRVPDSLLTAFPPSADLLLDRARRKTDDAMLMAIARADYAYGADGWMAALRSIRDTGVFAYCGEVLNFAHLANLEASDAPPMAADLTILESHQARLFACVLLLRIEADLPDELRLVTGSALARCLISSNALGEEMSVAAGCYLTWWLSRWDDGTEPFRLCYDPLLFAFGLLYLATRLRSGRFTEPGLGAIAYWVLTIESLARMGNPLNYGDRPSQGSVGSGFWQPLVAEFKEEAESIRDDDARTNLQLCAILLDWVPRRRRRW
jgi:hypothetical protein